MWYINRSSILYCITKFLCFSVFMTLYFNRRSTTLLQSVCGPTFNAFLFFVSSRFSLVGLAKFDHWNRGHSVCTYLSRCARICAFARQGSNCIATIMLHYVPSTEGKSERNVESRGLGRTNSRMQPVAAIHDCLDPVQQLRTTDTVSPNLFDTNDDYSRPSSNNL